ncbi:CPBP family intramembrane glutamic endopeptidase [Paractinoplanes hotanensis]|uniref:CPBP family glutamic-type intramembrane protease n=1 Tax=Paractinoplanes hotanensis TaxID=2906497 RepID=A0ABT0Y7V7_9ACTN|nr:CPBP family glutamic-type intramembrane protease [Actinoplanes hotanensis]MCM4082133.1 CPBP family glutamic-type intramembrane protease [Actinoplanes hotanensis]
MRAAARTLIGLVLAYLPMWLPPLTRAAGVDVGVTGPASSILWNALAVVLLVAYIFGVERRRLDSIRVVRPTGKDLEWVLILFGCHMAWAWLARTVWPPPADGGTATIAAMPVLAVVALVLSAAVFEEVLYRGYPIERLTELTGRIWPALAITVPLFVAPHLVFFSPSWLLYQASGTLALYVLFVWRRNLIACMLLHLAVNLPILIPTVAGR